MDLSSNQFEVLTLIEKEKERLCQRRISELLKLSLGTVNKAITFLLKNNLIAFLLLLCSTKKKLCSNFICIFCKTYLLQNYIQ